MNSRDRIINASCQVAGFLYLLLVLTASVSVTIADSVWAIPAAILSTAIVFTPISVILGACFWRRLGTSSRGMISLPVLALLLGALLSAAMLLVNPVSN